MVDFSLRKTKGFTRQPTISKNQISAPSKPLQASNPYASMTQQQPSSSNISNPYASLALQNTDLPSIGQKDKAKMGKSMQRRMSVHVNNVMEGSVRQIQSSNAPALPKVDLSQYQQSHLSMSVSPEPLERVGSEQSQRPMGELPLPLQPQQPQIQQLSLQQPPTVPGAATTSYKRSFSSDLNDPETIKVLSLADFNADSFVTSRLSESTASEIEKFSNGLTSLNKKVVHDINSLSVETYEKLMESMKELRTTESELRFLRGAITELTDVNMEMRETAEKRVQLELDQTAELTRSNTTKTASSSAAASASASASSSNQAYRRQSIVVLEKLWNTEMQSLFKHVEGAQRYFTAIPGRHIIAESGRWFELNAATFKVLQPAHIFILNDLVLIATRRRKVQKKLLNEGQPQQQQQQQALIADQCWPLREIKLTEVGSPAAAAAGSNDNNNSKIVHTINISYNSLSYTYQTDRHDQYLKIIKAYKRARDELRDIMEAEDIRKKKLRDSMQYLALSEGMDSSKKRTSASSHSRKSSTGGGLGSMNDSSSGIGPRKLSRSASSNNMLQDISTRMHTRAKSIDVSSNCELLKAIDDQIDLQDVLLFRKSYDRPIKAFASLEAQLLQLKDRCTEEELLLANVLSLKIQSRKQSTVTDLLSRMKYSPQSSPVSSAGLHTSIRHLISLNQQDLARQHYLSYQSQLINDLISKIPENKDSSGRTEIEAYVVELSIVLFQNLKLTTINYKPLFASPSEWSYLSSWLVSQTKKFISKLTDTLSGVKLRRSKLEWCVLVVRRQYLELKDFGCDLGWLMDGFFEGVEFEEEQQQQQLQQQQLQL